MSDPYIGRHRSGEGSPGYSRGRREKPAMAPENQSVQLGLMTSGNIMAYHEHNRQREYNIHFTQKNLAKASHPSAGSRSEEFLAQAVNYGNAAGESFTNMKVAGSTTKPQAVMQGRKENFELGRARGFAGEN